MFALALLLSAASAEDIHCFPDTLDADGDGYAVSTATSADQEVVSTTEALSQTCPAGYVLLRGDCDDTDPDVRPRQREVRENSVDDNCDGKVDETEFYYSPWGTFQEVDGFEIPVRISDDALVSAFTGALYDLEYKLEYQELEDTGTTYTTTFAEVDWLWDYGSYAYTHLAISGLADATVYRVRAQFYRKLVVAGPGGVPMIRRTAIGPQTGWYYSMTDSANTLASARMEIVLQGLAEYGDNQEEEVGYLGSDDADGTRYGADMGEAWCSEFYSWTAGSQLPGMGSMAGVSGLETWFTNEGNHVDIDASNLVLVEWFAQPGDWMGEDTDLDGDTNHSAMFLAWDDASGEIITLDGNTNGRVDLEASSRLGGNEVSLRRREPAVIQHWGWLDSGML